MRGEGLRPDRMDRPQAVATDGSLHPSDPRGGSASGCRLRARDREGSRSNRRRGRDRDRRPPLVPGVSRRSRRPWAGPREPVLDSGDHPEPRGGLGLDRARYSRTASLGVHSVRCLEHGHRRRQRRDQARARGRDALRRHRGGGVRGRDRRLRRHARALASQRRPTARLAPVRCAAGRLVMGEAGALLVLEELEHAKARGAKIYAEVAGYGLSSDAKHITDPDPTGPVTAFKMALGDAGVGVEEIDYINAHATSTPVGDSSETQMLKYALGEENAYKTPVSGTKGATGHCLGAAGAVEATFTVLSIRDGKLPPTINYEVEDPTCDLDYVPNEARDADVKVAVSNSFGFGGHNACVVFTRYAE